MALVLPDGHPQRALGVSAGTAEARQAVRLGIINIMPKLEAYEPTLLAPLASLPELVEPVFVRLRSHVYQSSDSEHLERFYQPFDAAIAVRSLDGLIITGAPVEELAFEDVRYWRELQDILAHARTDIRSTLGICWGGLAIGRVLGIEKRMFSKKLFGVFSDRGLVEGHDIAPAGASFVCAQSRHSGIDGDELECAARAGVVNVVSRGEQTGYTMFETPDRRFLAHLGHPEYEGERLALEWERDRALGRTDVSPPENFDHEHPTTPWRAHRQAVFAGVVRRAAPEAPA